MNIEQALKSELRPSTFEALSRITGKPISRIRVEFANNVELHSLMHANKVNGRIKCMSDTVKLIESTAKEDGITNRQASIRVGLCGDTHSRFSRQLERGINYKMAKHKEYADKIRKAVKAGATSVLKAAKAAGVPSGCVHGAVGGCEDIFKMAEVNAKTEKDKRYKEGYKAICEQLSKGLTINEASDAAGLDRNFYYRSRKHLGIYVKSKPEPERTTNVPGGAYNRLLTMPLTGKRVSQCK